MQDRLERRALVRCPLCRVALPLEECKRILVRDHRRGGFGALPLEGGDVDVLTQQYLSKTNVKAFIFVFQMDRQVYALLSRVSRVH